jgi:hypothetical protein
MMAAGGAVGAAAGAGIINTYCRAWCCWRPWIADKLEFAWFSS